MSFASLLRCTGCGAEFAFGTEMNLCPHDRRPVQLVIDTDRLADERPDGSWYQPGRPDMWRFGGLLGLDIGDPADQPFITALGEGHTPELDAGALPAARALGLKLTIKEEGRPYPGWGANPTGSFKDRGMAMAISMARRHGIDRVAVPTQGNAGDSLCRYAEAAGISAVVAMPDDTPMPILGRVAALAHANEHFHLVRVSGTIREAGAVLAEDWIPQGWFSMATFQEPGWRIEGKKTLGLELAEPDAPGSAWSLPDAVIYPTGGGTGVLGMWKAWDELEALGLIDDRRPRVICIQSRATRPLVNAFESGADDTVPADAGETLAVGLNVPGGVGHFRVLDIIRSSGGAAVAVDDDDMAEALRDAWHQRGWWLGPEGAACLAALPELVDRQLVRAGERVVAFNTGSLEKYWPDLRHLLYANA